MKDRSICFFLIAFLLNSFASFSQSVNLVVQTGHTSSITRIIYSPGENFIASTGEDGKIILWDVKLGKQYNSILEPMDEISDLAFINDSLLASSYLSGKIKIWNIHNASLVNEFSFKNPIGCIYKLNEEGLIFGSYYLGYLNIHTGAINKFDITVNGLFTTIKANRDVSSLAIGGNNLRKYFLLQINKTEVPSFTLKRTYSGTATGFSFDEETGNLITSSKNGKVVSNTPSGTNVSGLTSDFPTNSFNAVESNAKYIFAASSKSGLFVLDKSTFQKKVTITDHVGKTNTLAITKDGQQIASAGTDHSILIWDANKLQFLKKLTGKVERINSIAFAEDGNTICIGYSNGTFRTSNLITGESHAGVLEPSKVSKSLGWSYSVAQVKPKPGSSEEFYLKFYQAHNSTQEKGEVYDQIKEYYSEWNINKKSQITLVPSRRTSDCISTYINRLKNSDIPYPEQLYNDSLLKSKSDKLGIEVNGQGNTLMIKNIADGSTRMIECNHTDRISSVAINEKYRYIATAGWDGLIKLWDINSGQLIITYGAFGSNDFIFIDSDNNYYISKGSLGYIAFRYANKAYPFDQFDLKFNRPDIVLGKLPFGSKEVVENFKKAYDKRLSKLKLKEEDLQITDKIPTLKLSLPEKLVSKDGQFSFSVSAKDENVELDNICVFVNGVPEGSRSGLKINGKQAEQQISISLCPGSNYIQVFANNVNGVSSLKESFNVFNDAPLSKPELYVVLMGVSEYKDPQYNLKYAQKDAKDLGGYLTKGKYFNKVNIKYLLNTEVTLESVKSLSEFLKPAKPEDVVLCFIAGHGVLDENLDYYLASSDMDFNKPSLRGINYEIMDAVLESTKSRNRILFIDACHSGEVDKDEVKVSQNQSQQEEEIAFRSAGTNITNIEKVNSFELAKAVFVDFRANNGAWVISSAGATEYAMEGGKWNNGVFTYSLLNGLNTGKADLNKDKKIMLSELKDFLIREVQQVTNGKQKPNVRNENLFNDIRIK
jgi:WD40 repeat protein